MSLEEVQEKLWTVSASRSKKSRGEFNKLVKQLVYQAAEFGVQGGVQLKADLALKMMSRQEPDQPD
jgi:hypothetical protein